MKHSWNHWYIRDGHGNPRPLWHRERYGEDKSSAKGWKGYRARREYLSADDHSGGSTGELTTSSTVVYDDQEESDGRAEIYDGDDGDSTFDDYGRLISEGSVAINGKSFHPLLRENPYRGVMADDSTKPDKEFPDDQPILQFWTWRESLLLVPSENPRPKPESGLCRYDIADASGDWCGSTCPGQRVDCKPAKFEA